MNTVIFAILSILLYLAATAILVRSMVTGVQTNGWPPKSIFFAVGTPAAVFHGLTVSDIYSSGVGANLTFFNAAALVMLIAVLLLFAASFSKPVEKLGIFIFPLASIVVLLKMLFPDSIHVLKDTSWEMNAHIMISIAAYSLLNIAAVQAVFLAFQDWQLHHPQTHQFFRALPPLVTMESLLFQMIGAGGVFLTFSLLTGFLFIEDIFAQHLAHKTVLSLLAWVVFAILLYGRVRHGWRGRTAIRWTLSGFLFLLLAYFGSKLVLEIILERT